MLGMNQRKLLLGFLENAPTLGFLAAWQLTGDLETGGWVGVALAFAVLVGFRVKGIAYHPILLGINVYLLVITPVIKTLFWLGAWDAGQALVEYAQPAVVAAVFVVGSVLTLFSATGFIGIVCETRAKTRRLSAYLLAASAAAVVWAFGYDGSRLITIALPLGSLFALRQFLIAGLNQKDRGGDTLSSLVTASGAGASEPLDQESLIA